MKKFLCEQCKCLREENRFDVCQDCIRVSRSLEEVYRRMRLRFPKIVSAQMSLPEAMAWMLYKASGNPEDKTLALQIKEWTE